MLDFNLKPIHHIECIFQSFSDFFCISNSHIVRWRQREILCANESGVRVCYKINRTEWETQYESEETGSNKKSAQN